ncbi:MAG: hypothetical protein RL338_851 [Chloroflexota bacterium]
MAGRVATAAERTVVVGTAGHIDHGKTTLLRALTGIDADRLPEERRRGMTIDVGYAHLSLPGGRELDFVDVPGHDRLVGNMLVGAGEIDAVLLVVAADDGPRAQTLEHLELLDALGLRRGIAVVTKVDAPGAGGGRAAAVVAETAALLARTTLAGSPVVAVSAVTGSGLDELREALAALAAEVAGSPVGADASGAAPPGPAVDAPPPGPAIGAPAPARYAVDRVFAVKGRGTVVTGTLRGGPLAAGRTLRLLPGGGELRVRGLEVHGAPRDRSPAGGRVALNVGGVEPGTVERGAVLTDDAAVVATSRLLVAVRPPALATEPRWPLPAGATFRFHLGTAAVEARVRRSARERADGLELLSLVLERPVAAAPGDRFVLRRPAPGATAAGGIVLDPAPARGPSRRRATPERLSALHRAVTGAAGAQGSAPIDEARLALHGWLPATRALAPDLRATAEAAALAAVEAHHAADPVSAGLPLVELRRASVAALRREATMTPAEAAGLAAAIGDDLVAAGRLARDGDLVRAADRAAGPGPELAAAMARLEAALSVAMPPPLAEAARVAGCPPEGIRLLESGGRLVRLEADLAWSTSTYANLASTALALARRGPLTPAAFRDATGSSRRFALAILEDLGRRGILSRTDAGHVVGPRAPRPGTST